MGAEPPYLVFSKGAWGPFTLVTGSFAALLVLGRRPNTVTSSWACRAHTQGAKPLALSYIRPVALYNSRQALRACPYCWARRAFYFSIH